MAVSFQLTGVAYRYPNADPCDPAVLRDLNLTIPSGKVTAIVGRSGVGKSTLLYLLGLLWEKPPNQGEITYTSPDGAASVSYAELTAEARAELRLREFGFALQSGYLIPMLYCGENMAMPM